MLDILLQHRLGRVVAADRDAPHPVQMVQPDLLDLHLLGRDVEHARRCRAGR